MKKMVFIVSMVCFMFTFNNGFSQDLVQYPVSDSIENQAKDRANELMQNLGLTTKQALLVEDKLTEFLGYEKKVKNSKWTVAQKKNELKVLNARKLVEMRDVLSEVQYDIYLKNMSIPR